MDRTPCCGDARRRRSARAARVAARRSSRSRSSASSSSGPSSRSSAAGSGADGSLDLDRVRRHAPPTRACATSLRFTVWQAALSTRAHPRGRAPGRVRARAACRFRGRALVHALVIVPFVLPTIVVGDRVPRRSASTGSLGAILLAHVFFNYAVVVRTVGGARGRTSIRAHRGSRADARRGPVAHVLVASRSPRCGPRSSPPASIVFLFCFTSFGVILVLGGPTFATLETEIYRQTAQLLDLRIAAALAIVQLAAVLAALERRRLGPRPAHRARSGCAPRARSSIAAADRRRPRVPRRQPACCMAALLGRPDRRARRAARSPTGLDAYRALDPHEQRVPRAADPRGLDVAAVRGRSPP